MIWIAFGLVLWTAWIAVALDHALKRIERLTERVEELEIAYWRATTVRNQ